MTSAAGATDPVPPPGRPVLLWDWPVRLVHWSFVILLPAMWWTAENGEMGWHFRLGLLMLGLLAFRLLWGFIGSQPARFAHFLAGPRRIIAYLRGRAEYRPGHNPLGGWSVLVMLLMLATQTGLGLVAGDEDDGTAAPLNHLVSFRTANRATALHEDLFNLLLVLVILHVLAVIVHLAIKRDNLLGPMISGRRQVPASVAAPAMAGTGRALLCAILAAALVAWVQQGAPGLG